MTGQELHDLRTAHGLTRKALGAMLGYSANYIARLEKGFEKSGDGERLIPITPRCEKLIRSFFSTRKAQKSS